MLHDRYELFISYRRKDSVGKEWGTSLARNVYQALESRGYKGRVFLDHNKIGPEDFEAKILNTIKQSRVFIFILTKESLIRCNSEGDWVRREILQALESKIKMIFINPDNEFQNDYPENFPDELMFIKTLNRIELRTGSGFERDMDSIVRDYINPIYQDIKSNIVFTTDLDCSILNSGKEIGVVKVGEKFVAELLVGDRLLEFVSIENDKIRLTKVCKVEEGKLSVCAISFNPKRSAILRIGLVVLFILTCSCGLYYVGKTRARHSAEVALEYYQNNKNTTKAYLDLREAQKRLEKYGFDKGDELYDRIEREIK